MTTATRQPTANHRQRNVLEYTQAQGKPRRIDRQAGIIAGVKVLGEVSLNGQRYTRQALEKARALYEGTRVFVDHPEFRNASAERSLSDQFGWLENVRLESDGLYGDLHFIKSHPNAGFVCEMAERAPGKFGLSHNAVVSESANDPNTYISIERVRSVDLVCKPATTKGIFESVSTASQSGEDWTWALFADRAQKVFKSGVSPQEKVKEIGRLARILLDAKDTIDRIMKGGPDSDGLSDDSEDATTGDTSDTMESRFERADAIMFGGSVCQSRTTRDHGLPGRSERFADAYAKLHRR